MEARLRREGYRPVDSPPAETAASPAPGGGCSARNDERGSSEATFHLAIDNMDGMDRESAAVVFVIIGAVVVVVWSLYAFKYAYDLAAGVEPCGRWSEWSIASSTISGDASDRARFNGVRAMGGFREGYTDFGLSAEVGQAAMELKETDSLKLRGTYWFVGPVLRWRLSADRNPNFFQMEFLGGSTTNRETGLLGEAKAALSFGVGNNARWGLSVGAMNINLKDNQGIISARSKYYYLFGLETGFRF